MKPVSRKLHHNIREVYEIYKEENSSEKIERLHGDGEAALRVIAFLRHLPEVHAGSSYAPSRPDCKSVIRQHCTAHHLRRLFATFPLPIRSAWFVSDACSNARMPQELQDVATTARGANPTAPGAGQEDFDMIFRQHFKDKQSRE